jgi:hypothetical protein
MIDRPLGEISACREAGVAGPDDNGGDLLEATARQTTSTVTLTGFVMAS